MNKELINQIVQNTNLDKKDFLATYAKVGEENGELAKEILSYLNEPTNLHRYSTKKNILEECVDSILTVYSLALKVGATPDDIEEMMGLKLSKWSTILTNEGRLKNIETIPFEYHCTFAESNFSYDDLKIICAKYGAKFIELELELQDKSIVYEYMTSSIYYGKNSDAIQMCEDLAENLEKEGLTIIRKKVETVAWHPQAPQTYPTELKFGNFEAHIEIPIKDNTPVYYVGPKRCTQAYPTELKAGYFEAHIEIPIIKDNMPFYYVGLKRCSQEFNAVFSRNVAKQSDEHYIQMATIREYRTNRTAFEKKVNEYIDELNKMKLNVSVPLLEYCLYDTNPELDNKWIGI